MNNFGAEPEELVNSELEACRRVIRSGWWILGEEVAAFEREWAQRSQARHAIGCGNGMDAIEIGLRASGIGAGDEVITTPMTAFATVLAIFRAGAIPVLADIASDTAMLCSESVARCISPRTKAILLVHLYGQAGPANELLALATDRGIHLVEDCAQSHGAAIDGRSVGTFGSFAAWSFYPTKNLGAIGDGGAVTTDSPDIAEKARALRNYGQTTRYAHPTLGLNSRLDELQAAILRERLRYLDTWTSRRKQIARRYSEEFRSDTVTPMSTPAHPAQHVYHLFVVRTTRRNELQRYLRDRQIDSLIHYPVPIHLQAPCRGCARDPMGLTRAENHAESCLSLPCHPGMTDTQVDGVIDAINKF